MKYYDLIAQYERQLLARALEDSGGDQTAAARSLDIGRTTLHEKVKLLKPTSADAALGRREAITAGTAVDLQSFATTLDFFPDLLAVLEIKLSRLQPTLEVQSVKFEISRIRKHIEATTSEAKRLHGRLTQALGV